MSKRNNKGQFTKNEQLEQIKDKVAQKFDVIDYIETLPGNVRRNVLFSMVGSINASLIGTASTMARRLSADGIIINELSPFEFETAMAGPDYKNGLEYGRNINAIAQRWRDDLVSLTDQDNAGALSETIDFMIKSPRQLDDRLLKATLEAAGITGVEPDIIKAKHDQMQKQRSERLAAERGQIEWIIDQCLFTEDEPSYSMLSEEQQQAMIEKLLTALNRTRDLAVIGILNKDRRWSFSDLPIISAAIKEVEQHA